MKSCYLPPQTKLLLLALFYLSSSAHTAKATKDEKRLTVMNNELFQSIPFVTNIRNKFGSDVIKCYDHHRNNMAWALSDTTMLELYTKFLKAKINKNIEEADLIDKEMDTLTKAKLQSNGNPCENALEDELTAFAELLAPIEMKQAESIHLENQVKKDKGLKVITKARERAREAKKIENLSYYEQAMNKFKKSSVQLLGNMFYGSAVVVLSCKCVTKSIKAVKTIVKKNQKFTFRTLTNTRHNESSIDNLISCGVK